MSKDLMQIEPCAARGTLKEELYTKEGWWAEEKYDGDRRLAHFTVDGVRFTGRRKSVEDGLFVEKTENLPHLKALGGTGAAGLVGTVLDGEVLFPGGRSKDVTSIMGSLPAEAIRKQQERGWLQYVVFDCLFFHGKDARGEPLTTRRKLAENALERWANQHARISERADEDRRKFCERIWARGGEGIILKDGSRPYGDKKSWVKVKKEFTEDCVIVGFKLPKATSKKKSGEVSETRLAANGWIGSVVLGQYLNGRLVEIGDCAGFGDMTLANMTVDPTKYLMQVVEVTANEREPTGAFRHARFERFRDDKNAKDCTVTIVDGEVFDCPEVSPSANFRKH